MADDQEIRLECLRLAVGNRGFRQETPEKVVRRAELYLDFVLDAGTPRLSGEFDASQPKRGRH